MASSAPRERKKTAPRDIEASARRARTRGAALEEPAVLVSSFAPQVGEGCRVLVLGTVPSLRSLQMQQSYAHPHNLFWRFMGELYGAGPELPYAERIARLHACGVGIWDVLKHCERPGSLDSSIRPESEVPNDIPGLLDAYPSIRAIVLNGGKARDVFARKIAPRIDEVRRERLEILALPSTSPANASISREAKLERWRAMLAWAPRKVRR